MSHAGDRTIPTAAKKAEATLNARSGKQSMSIQRAEELKREWTDRFVIVQSAVPELRRFTGLVGQVKTVNMNCRLLIEFDAPADISWYDIDPQFAQVVDPREVEKKTIASKTEDIPANPDISKIMTAKPAVGKPVTQPAANPATASPLDLIRKQASSSPPDAGVADSKSSSKPNPLDLIRKQSAVDANKTIETRRPSTGSPLDLIRSQAAAAPVLDSEPKKAKETALISPTPAGSPLDLIRAQFRAAETPAQVTPGKANAEKTTARPSQSVPEVSGESLPPAIAAADQTSTAVSEPASDFDAASSTRLPSSNTVSEIARPADSVPVASDSVHATAWSSSSAIDQIRAQAASDSSLDSSLPTVAEQHSATLFDLVKTQADNDELDSQTTVLPTL